MATCTCVGVAAARRHTAYRGVPRRCHSFSYVAGHGGATFNVIQAVSPSGKTLWVSPILGGQPATVGVDEHTQRVVLGCNTGGGYGTTAYIYALDMKTGACDALPCGVWCAACMGAVAHAFLFTGRLPGQARSRGQPTAAPSVASLSTCRPHP